MISPRSFKRRVAAATVLAYAMTLFSPILSASERRLDGSKIDVRHRDRTFVDGAHNAKITEKPVYLMRKGETVTIEVTDPNPLLFSYDSEVVTTETDQHKAAAELAKALATIVASFGTPKGGGPGKEQQIVEGLNLNVFMAKLNDLYNDVDAIPSKIDQSIVSAAEATRMKGEVLGWEAPKLAAFIRDAYVKVNTIAGKCLRGLMLQSNMGPISCSAKFETGNDLAVALDGPDRDDSAWTSGPSADAPDPQAISNQQPPRPGTAPSGNQPSTNISSNQSAAVTPPAAAPSGDSIHDFVTLALAMKSTIDDSLKALTSFVADVSQIDVPRTLKAGKDQDQYDYSLDDRTVTVVIEPSTKYDEFLSPEAKKFRQAGTGKFPLVLRAYSPVSLGVAPALVILFGTNPTFKAVKSGEQFEIQRENPQGTSYNVAVMMTIVPRAWSEPTFGGQFQLGVSPTKNDIGFYAGAGITVQNLFTFGVGGAWHQVDQLSGGLSVGQKIGSPDLLKLDKVYKGAFYFHITTNLNPKK